MIKVCRYERIDRARLQTLDEGKLWCSAPSSFNDLSDCSFELANINTPLFTWAQIKSALDALYVQGASPQHSRVSDYLISLVRKYLEAVLNPDGEKPEIRRDIEVALLTAEIYYYIKETTGVCCFFKSDPVNPLMWAYYGDNHSGICVEYEVDEDAAASDGCFFKVRYSNQRPLMCPLDFVFTPISSIVDVTTTKRSIWSHEREYRIVLLNKNREGETGNLIDKPDWLRPTRIIRGEKFSGYDWNEDIYNTVKSLGISSGQVVWDSNELRVLPLY